MRSIPAALSRVALAAVLLAACGAPDADAQSSGGAPVVADSDDKSVQNDVGMLIPAPVQFGRVSDFEPGINELDVPRRVFIIVEGEHVTAFDRKDPNNGCVLSAVDDEATVTFEIANADAHFYDPCHGNTYDLAGQPLHCQEARSMNSIDVLVEDGIATWAGLDVDPGEPAPRSRPDCPGVRQD